MKYIIVLFVLISISIQPRPQKLFKHKLKEFHTEMVGEDSVNNFHRIFPFIVSDDYVYLGYLQGEFYNNKQFIKLLKYDYYKRTMSKSN